MEFYRLFETVPILPPLACPASRRARLAHFTCGANSRCHRLTAGRNLRSGGIGMRSRVVLADDDGLLLGLLERILEQDFDIVATATDGKTLIDDILRLSPDVA